MVQVGRGSRIANATGITRLDTHTAQGPARPAMRLVLRSGHTLLAAPSTRVLAAGVHGPVYRRLDKLGTGDHVAVQLGAGARAGRWPAIIDWDATRRRLDPSLALVLGVLAARGSRGGNMVKLVITEEPLRARLANLLTQVSLPNRPSRNTGSGEHQLLIPSRPVLRWLSDLGVLVPSQQRRIPDPVLQAPPRLLAAFLQGLSLHYVITHDQGRPTGVKLDSASPALTADTQTVLTHLGILSAYDIDPRRGTHRIRIVGAHAQQLLRLAPPLQPSHTQAAQQLLATSVDQARRSLDIVPFADGPTLWRRLPNTGATPDGPTRPRRRYNHLRDPRTKAVSRTTITQLADILGPDLPAALRRVLDDRLHFLPIRQLSHEPSHLVTHNTEHHPLWIDGLLIRP